MPRKKSVDKLSKEDINGKLVEQGIYKVISKKTGKVSYTIRGKFIKENGETGQTRDRNIATLQEARERLLRRKTEAKHYELTGELPGRFYNSKGIEKITFSELMNQYFSYRYNREKVTERTERQNRAYFKNHLVTLHNYNIDEITMSMIDEAFLEPRFQNLNTKKKNTVIRFLKLAFDYAEQRGYIRKNITRDIEKFKDKKEAPKKDVVLTVEQMQMYSNTIRERESIPKRRANMYGDCVEFLFYTGMRMAECIAVRFCDIDENNCIHLTEQWYKNERHETKTPHSKREVYLNDRCMEIVNRLKDELKNEKGFNEQWYLFYGRKPMNQNTLQKQLDWAYGKFVEREIDIPRITPHKLRHSITSILVKNNVPIATVARQLGHSNDSITLKVYTHEFESDKTLVLDTLNKLKD